MMTWRIGVDTMPHRVFKRLRSAGLCGNTGVQQFYLDTAFGPFGPLGPNDTIEEDETVDMRLHLDPKTTKTP